MNGGKWAALYKEHTNFVIDKKNGREEADRWSARFGLDLFETVPKDRADRPTTNINPGAVGSASHDLTDRMDPK